MEEKINNIIIEHDELIHFIGYDGTPVYYNEQTSLEIGGELNTEKEHGHFE